MKHKFIVILSVVFTLIISIGLLNIRGTDGLEPLSREGSNIYHYNTNDPVMIPSTYTQSNQELRGAWVATVFQINMPTHDNESQYKAAYDALIDDFVANNMNAILFQVRPMNDAFYESDYATWSRYLTGSEGTDPGWDVMEYLVTTAHENGLEFHAWMNPYRVGNSTLEKNDFLNTLHNDNFAVQNPDLVTQGEQSNGLNPYILDPGKPEVKDYIVNVVEELMEKYPVDGIHFDDYFYPYSGMPDNTETYQEYAQEGQSEFDFRVENINDAVRMVKEAVDDYNATSDTMVRFGISPFGIWDSEQNTEGGSNTHPGALSSYTAQYADSKRWVEEEWLHYINPQIYWQFDHSMAPYADVVDWWASLVEPTDVDLIVGHSIANAENWADDEIATQLIYNQKYPEITGSIMYSASFLNGDNMQTVRSSYWTETPSSVWRFSDVSMPGISLDGVLDGDDYRSDVQVTIESELDVYYRIGGGNWQSYGEPVEITENGTYVIYAKAINQDGDESLVASKTLSIEKINEDIPRIQVDGNMIGDNYVETAEVILDSDEYSIYIAINHGTVGDFELYEEPITLTSLGSYFIRVKTVSDENIDSDIVTKRFDIVEECYDPPVFNIEGTGDGPYYQEATVSMSYDAPEIEIKINDGNYEPYSDPIVLKEEGEYTLKARNISGCENEVEATIIIDQTPPSEPTVDLVGDFDGWYYIEPVELTIESDETVYFRLHNGRNWSNWQVFDEKIHLARSVTYTLEYYAVDQALNQTEVFDQRIRVNLPVSEDMPWVVRDGEIVTYYNSNEQIALPIYEEKTEEIRAIWVSTVFNIDTPIHQDETSYKEFIDNMLDTIKAHNFNTVFYQVRPMNDAFYPSEYAPFSAYLAGEQGKDPGWDVLDYIVEQSHLRGLELHAWLNPYRVATGSQSKSVQLGSLHEDNFAKQNPDLVMADNNNQLILNPGEPEVRTYIYDIVNELMENYDIDGIHFDDYFYSYAGMSGSEDLNAFNRENPYDLSLDDWRRENVNILVKELFEHIDSYNSVEDEFVKFGISPFGIWASDQQFEGGSNTSPNALSSYISQYADSKKWVEEGWLHYINPQLYWEFDHSVAPYADLVDWWADLSASNDVDLIIGQGFYRYADGSWSEPNELLEQLRYNAQYDSIIGSAFFTYNTLNDQHTNVKQAIERLNTHYWTDYVTFPWESTVEPSIPIECDEGYELDNGDCIPIDDNGDENSDTNDNGVQDEDDSRFSTGIIALISSVIGLLVIGSFIAVRKFI